jgi:MFS transporter, CP family, cyanate transporter
VADERRRAPTTLRRANPNELKPRRLENIARFGLLWAGGTCLRMTILAIPPLLPAIHRTLHLDEKLVGALTALPILLLSAAALLGSLLVSRLGPRRALIGGLGLVAVAGGLRGLGPSVPMLFGMTLLMGIGISVSQPAFPSLVRQWFPRQVGTATAIYTNGFLVGEVVAVSFTVPFILPLLGNSWPLALLFWSLPILLVVGMVQAWTPHIRREAGGAAPKWWPDWKSERTWRLGFILGCASISYFGANAFIPDYLKAMHHPGYITAALTTLNIAQLPASFLVIVAPQVFIRRRWSIAASALIMFIGAVGLYASGPWMLFGAALLGFTSGMIFILSLALPPLLADEGDVHRLSAAMFAITYTCSFGTSLLGGALWDATGIPQTSFLPVVVAGPAMLLLVLGLDLSAQQRASESLSIESSI